MSIGDNQYIVIQKFMVEQLKLKGNELIMYAVIYGFSQDGATRFKGSQQYLADWCGISTRQTRTILQSLEDKGLINKTETFYNKMKFNSYSINFLPTEKTSYGKEEASNDEEIISKVEEKTSEYNIEDNIDNNDNNIINNKRKSFHKFGMYKRILLTTEQYDKLCTDFGKDVVDRQITLLDEYVQGNNNKNGYKDFNIVLRKSIRNNWFKQNFNKSYNNNPNANIVFEVSDNDEVF